MALEIPGAIESAHGNHPDFRLGGKVFASLGYPDDRHAMVKLTPEQQQSFIEEAPEVFAPCAGAWGRQGATSVLLEFAKTGSLQTALEMATRNVSSKKKRS